MGDSAQPRDLKPELDDAEAPTSGEEGEGGEEDLVLTEDDLHPVTAAIARARSGLRSQVEALLQLLEEERLLVPLRKAIAGVNSGDEVDLDAMEGEGPRIAPHLLVDEDGEAHVALFSEEELIDPFVEALDWTTDDDQLELCALPGRLALQVALDLIDGDAAVAAVLNPGDETELQLRRDELAALVAGRAVPLVGYVEEVPDGAEGVLVADSGPPPRALVAALERAQQELGVVRSFELATVMDPERDLEPHWVLRLRVADDVDRNEIARAVTSRLEGLVPPPGYLDVWFDDRER